MSRRVLPTRAAAAATALAAALAWAVAGPEEACAQSARPPKAPLATRPAGKSQSAPAGAVPPQPSTSAAAGEEDRLPPRAIARFGSARLHHGTWIKCLEYSPDGKILASGGGHYSQPGGICLWDMASGKMIRQLAGHQHGVTAITFSPDGKTLASAGQDRTIRFWNVADGKPATDFRIGSVQGNWVAFSPDGRTVAVRDGSNIRLVEATTGAKGKDFGRGFFCAFSPDGKRVAVTSSHDLNAGIRVLDVTTGKDAQHVETEKQRFTVPAFSPDGRWLAAGCSYGTDAGIVMLWDARTGQLKRKLKGHPNYVNWVSFNPAGTLLASGSQVGSVIVWDIETGEQVRQLATDGSQAYAAVFSPDGRYLAAGGISGQIRCWDVKTYDECYVDAGHRGQIQSVALSRDGQWVLTGGQDGTVRQWDVNGTALHRFGPWAGAVMAVAISPDGRLLAACGGDEMVRVWDCETGAQRQSVKVPSGPSLKMFFRADGHELIAAGPTGGLSRIDLASGAAHLLQPGGKATYMRMAFSADCSLGASAANNVAQVWDLASGRRTGTFVSPNNSHLYAIELDPFGRVLAGDSGRQLFLFEIDSGKMFLQVPRTGMVGASTLAFSRDGEVIAASEMDGDITFWSAISGKTLGQLKGHRNRVTAMEFSPDGMRLLTGSADTTAILWSLAGIVDGPGGTRGKLSDKDLAAYWDMLASPDAAKAQEAVFALIGGGDRPVDFLAERLRSDPGPGQGTVQALIAELGHAQYAKRKQATEKLMKMGAIAEAPLRDALTDSSSEEVRARVREILAALDEPLQRQPDLLRSLRAIHVLERIGSAKAQSLLGKLATGHREATLTRAAAAALGRLANPAPAGGG